MHKKHKLLRITTVPISMNHIMRGQLKYMNQYYEVIGVSSYVEKDVNDILSREQIPMKFVEMPRTINPIKDLLALIKLCFLILKEKPNIVHTHTPKAGLLGMLASFICKVPIRLHTVAGMPLEETQGLKRRILLFTEKLTYKLAHQIYPNSLGLKKFILQQQLAKPEKVKVLAKGSSNGINNEHFNKNYIANILENRLQKRNELGIEPTDFVFCFIGRLAEAKGIAGLCDSFLELNKEFSNTKLLLVGPIEMANSKLSDATIELINQNKNIIYPGRAEDIRPILNLSDCFVFPSYREGFPGVLMQAGAMGVPIIASDIGGNNELIKNNLNGLLFEVKNIGQLQNTMKIVYNNLSLREQLAENMSKTISNDYQNSTVWNAIKNEYDNWISIKN